MDQNPFRSPQSPPDGPASLDPQWRAFAPRRRPRQLVALERPTAVTVIAVLQLLFIPLQMLLTLGTSTDLIVDRLQQVGLSPGIVLGVVFASWTLGMASALGMWSGARWGWWSGAFFYASSLLHTLLGLVYLGVLAQRNLLDHRLLTINALWLVVRIPVMALILILFFSDDFLAYFACRSERKHGAAAGIAAAAVAAVAAEIGVLWLMRY